MVQFKNADFFVIGRVFLKQTGLTGFLLFLYLFAAVHPSPAQEKWQKEPFRMDPAVCNASQETGHSYVHPPAEFLNRLKSGKKSSNIVIQYVNTPDSVKPAIEYAVEIWEYLLSSSVPIYMQVNWQALSSSTLGSCGASSYYENFKGAPLANTYYPVAVVEKILAREISGSGNPDMVARFNSSISWYLAPTAIRPARNMTWFPRYCMK